MTVFRAPAAESRISSLAAVGLALFLCGSCSLVAAFGSSLARFMHVEDVAPWLSGEELHAVTQLTATDKGIIVASALIACAGLAALGAALVQRRRTGPAAAA